MTTTLPRDRGHSTNLVGVPTGLLANVAYNDYPIPLHIAGARQMYGSLFEMLSHSESAEDAGEAFHGYMCAAFGLEAEQQDGKRRFRSSYLRLLKGWGYDSNSPEGAVLKGWVESRFGLFPTFHKTRLANFSDDAWMTYVQEKMSSRFHNNAIHCQLDLLFEFCQWSLARYHSVGRRHMTLYRGVNSFDEHEMVERIDKRTVIVRLNNLMSFTPERETAEQFGDIILETQVPVTKILFFNTLMTHHPLKGEAEYLVIGGDYRVKATYF